jgi:hypothetical protein
MTEDAPTAAPRPRITGPNYRGRHRRPARDFQPQPGALVIEPGSASYSSIIRLLDSNNALVRHVGRCDDHTVATSDLRAAGSQVRCGVDFGDSD